MAKKKSTARKSSKKPAKKTSVSKKKQSPKMPIFKKLWSTVTSAKWEPVWKTVGLTLIILGSFVGVDLLVQYLNNDYSVAVVNGERISKRKYYKLLDQSYGGSVAETLIEYALIYQEAENQDVQLTDEEVDEELQATVDYVGGQEAYDELLVANGITNDDVVEQIEVSLLTTKLITPTLEYSDEDVETFFNEYSDLIFEEETAALEEGELLDFDEYKDATEEVYISQLVTENKDTWLEGLKGESVIQNNTTEKPSYGLLSVTRNIINNLIGSINSTTETEEE